MYNKLNVSMILAMLVVIVFSLGYVVGNVITKRHYENVIQKLEIQLKMSIAR